MIAVALVFSSVGALLILVGMVGGNFTFSGAVIPKVGKVARVLSTATGGIFVAVGLVAVLLDPAINGAVWPRSPVPPPATSHSPPPSEQPPPLTPSAPSTVTAPIVAGAGYTISLFDAPNSTGSVVAQLPDGYIVEIVCTMRGEAVTSELTGKTSSLWNGVSARGVIGFVPDVYVDTGTYQAVTPACNSTGV
jgi:hypothetical protein